MIDLPNKITSIAERLPNLKLLILFGSRARGEDRPDSDWDFAVLYDKNFDKLESSYLDLFPLLGELFNVNRDRIDIVELNHCSPLMKYQVARDGKVIYEKNIGDFLRFHLQAWKEYADTAKFRKAQKESIDLWLKKWGV
jgi:predicted nucleotidyltransferase